MINNAKNNLGHLRVIQIMTNTLLTKNINNKLKRIAKFTYYQKQLEANKNEIRNIWRVINGIINRSNDKSSFPNTFKINNMDENDPSTITNGFRK